MLVYIRISAKLLHTTKLFRVYITFSTIDSSRHYALAGVETIQPHTAVGEYKRL